MNNKRILFAAIGLISWLILLWFVIRNGSGGSAWAAGGALSGLVLAGGWSFQRARDAGAGRRSLRELREEIARESLRLERERAAFREELVMHYGVEAFLADESDGEEDDSRSAEDWSEQDLEVASLLRDESERLFRKLLDNAYVEGGEFNRAMLGDDLVRFVESVARVYQPDSERPLLETSVEQLLRAVNRASVQLLVHLDQLPVDIKSHNLREAYDRLRAAAKYYGYYKRVEPYWAYARPFYHLGRIALGANPITIGLGWAVSEMVKRGSVNLAHSYALRMFHETVRIFGNEAAEVFGGNFRHRDAGWVFGSELVSLIAGVQPDGAVREAALRELAAIPLKSEHDRLYLFGCLARNETAPGETALASAFLDLKRRQETALRLEQFIRAQGIDLTGNAAAKWKSRAENRLGLQFHMPGTRRLNERESAEAALRSLASFLIQFKSMNPGDVRHRLQATGTMKTVSEHEREALVETLLVQPPMLYELPALDPGSGSLERFLDDLIQLDLSMAPRFEEILKVIEETAGYFREDPEKWIGRYESRCRAMLASCGGDAPRVSGRAARLVLGQLADEEGILFLYTNAALENGSPGEGEDSLLCGTEKRLFLLSGGGVVWTAGRGEVVAAAELRQVVSNACELTGGRRCIDETQDAPARIVIQGRKMSVYSKYFAPLTAWVSENR